MNSYKNFIDLHKDREGIIVLGCGKSASLINSIDRNRFIIIGVNDIGRLITPDYLVILNNKHGFKGDRWQYVRDTNAKYVFTHLNKLEIKDKSKIVKISLGNYGKLNSIKDKSKVDYTNNSPYVACIIAYHLGAKKIGVLGVDFTNDHFFAKTGRHSLSGRLKIINKEYSLLAQNLKTYNIGLYNLSNNSLIKSISYEDPKKF